MTLKVEKDIQQYLSQVHASSSVGQHYSFIVYGFLGTGKTTLLTTAPKPILIDSFDPGGTNSIAHLVGDDNQIYVDTTYEDNDPFTPRAWERWSKTFMQRKKMGLFNKLGTYCIDSCTGWTAAAMYYELARTGRPGGVPHQQDWLPQMTYIMNAIRVLTSLPCHFILTGHLAEHKDAGGAISFVTLNVTGNLKTTLPAQFSEIYAAMAKNTSKGTVFSLLTSPYPPFYARSRLAARGKFALFEEPNITNLLNKAGVSTGEKED